jgi:hypothetical protein
MEELVTYSGFYHKNKTARTSKLSFDDFILIKRILIPVKIIQENQK